MPLAYAVAQPQFRTSQYCSNAYVELLQEHGIAISMTENGDPLENAITERINGILKQEYLDQWNLTTMAETVVALDRAVLLYNSDRPHNSIANHTPDEAHKAQVDSPACGRTTIPNDLL